MQRDTFEPLTLANLVVDDFARVVKTVECAIEYGYDDSGQPIQGDLDPYDAELAFLALLRRDLYQCVDFLFCGIARKDGGMVNFSGTQTRLHSELVALWEAARAIERAASASR